MLCSSGQEKRIESRDVNSLLVANLLGECPRTFDLSAETKSRLIIIFKRLARFDSLTLARGISAYVERMENWPKHDYASDAPGARPKDYFGEKRADRYYMLYTLNRFLFDVPSTALHRATFSPGMTLSKWELYPWEDLGGGQLGLNEGICFMMFSPDVVGEFESFERIYRRRAYCAVDLRYPLRS